MEQKQKTSIQETNYCDSFEILKSRKSKSLQPITTKRLNLDYETTTKQQNLRTSAQNKRIHFLLSFLNIEDMKPNLALNTQRAHREPAS